MDLYLVSSWIFTLILTVLSFGFVYSGLEKYDSASFSGDPSVIDFIKHSFCVLTTSSLSDIEPMTSVAKNLSLFNLVGTVILLTLLVFVILTSLRERYRKDLDRIVVELDEASSRFERVFENNYELSVQSAESWLVAYHLGVAKLLLRLTYSKTEVESLIEMTTDVPPIEFPKRSRKDAAKKGRSKKVKSKRSKKKKRRK